MQEIQEGATLWYVKCPFTPREKRFTLTVSPCITYCSALLVGGNVMKVLPLLALTCPLLPPFPTMAKIYHKKYMKRYPDAQGHAEINVNNQK